MKAEDRYRAAAGVAAPRDLLAEVLPAMPTMVDTARALNVSYSTVRRRIADGTLRAYRLGGTVRLDRQAVLDWARSEVVTIDPDVEPLRIKPRRPRRPRPRTVPDKDQLAKIEAEADAEVSA